MRGGQSVSFVAKRVDGSGGYVFIKKLRRQKDLRARKRFRREVAAYQTLQGTGVPRLLEENAEAWDNLAVPLYMILEYVEGPTLGQFVAEGGPISVDEANCCVAALGRTLESCHREGVIHRDLKPHNVILRRADITAPVLVDFGLSFNDEMSATDLTRVGEEVGNRFLRLPEHALGGRSPIADVTQLAGLYFFMLTGLEPRVLLDEDGHPPHTRKAARAKLTALFSGRQLLRVQSFFDRAFAMQTIERFRSVTMFQAALDSVSQPAEAADDFDALLQQVREITQGPDSLAQSQTIRALHALARLAAREVSNLAQEEGLTCTQTGHSLNNSDSGPRVRTQLALGLHGESPAFTLYCFERRAQSDLCTADGLEIWRGPAGSGLDDSALSTAIRRAALERFAASHARQDDLS